MFDLRKIFAALVLLGCGMSKSYAVETIQITKGHTNPTPIALNIFDADNSTTNRLGQEILSIIDNNLTNSGFLRSIPKTAFIETKVGIGHKPLFAAWRQINADVLLNAYVKKTIKGHISVSFILWDVVSEKVMVAEEVTAPTSSKRRIAHKISDRIYERVVGDKGYFDTQIAYISETGPALKRVKRVAIMDQDGANHYFLTTGRDLALTPRFSPKADRLLYMSYVNKVPRVYIKNTRSGQERVVGDFPGMSFAPRFSPDGNYAIMSMAQDGVTHLYEVNLANNKVSKLTKGVAINTSPSYSPDGKKIVFNSDRGSTRQLYIMNRDGSNVQRISYGGGSYAAPVWSPRGDYIAFTKINRYDGFTIGVMRADGSGERLIASGYLVEGATWAPNGRVIAFTKSERPVAGKKPKSRIYSVDLTGYFERELLTPKDASDPEWSLSLK